MTIDKDFLSNLSHHDDHDDDEEYKRNDSIEIGFEQELKSLTVHHGDSARFEAKISTWKSIDRSLLKIEWRLNDISIANDPSNNFKYQFGSLAEENRYWMDIHQCQQEDEKVYTIHLSYDHGRLHDESSAYLFVQHPPTEKEEQACEKELNNEVGTLDRYLPPTITRSLQSTYRYHPGEQLHFLVEYTSSTDSCQCIWQIQRSNDKIARSIDEALIVNADCSSILIIESITAELQGLYTFYVENIYGRAMTQTIVIINTNDLDDDIKRYEELEKQHNGHSTNELEQHSISVKPAIPSSKSSEYEETTYTSVIGKQSHELVPADVSTGKDLYGQRHIAYFDPLMKFEHVESIEQLESENTITRLDINDHRMKIGVDTTVGIPFELPPPPPIEEIRDEHIYEDIPNILSIPPDSITTSVQQQSIQIGDNEFSLAEQSSLSSPSPNSLDEVLNHVEQWSDIIVDNETSLRQSSYQILKILPLIPSMNEYVDEHFLDHQLDEISADMGENSLISDLTEVSNHLDLQETSIDDDDHHSHPVEDLPSLNNGFSKSEDNLAELYEQYDEQNDGNQIQSMTPEQKEKEKLASMYLSNDATTEEPSSIISLTIIHEKLPGDSPESLSVPVQPDLLPLATMPDQTTNTDEQRIPDRTVQDVLSASLEPSKVIHNEGTGEMLPIISFTSTEKIKDYEEFFDVEAEYTVTSEKPLITLAEAEKLQHDAAIEQKREIFVEPELDLATIAAPIILETPLMPSTLQISNRNDSRSVSEETLVDQTRLDEQLQTIEKHEEESILEQSKSIEKETVTNPRVQRSVSSESEKQKINGEDNSSGKKSQPTSIESFGPKKCDNVQQERLHPKFSFRLKPTITVTAGDNLKLEVHYIGQPEPKVTWFFKSDILKPSSSIHIDQSHDIHTFCSILTLEKINPSYDGKFKVKIQNDLGEAISTTQINIKRATIAVQLHTPMKKTSTEKTSTPQGEMSKSYSYLLCYYSGQ